MKTVYQLSDSEFDSFLETKTTNHKRKFKAQRKFELNAMKRGYSFHDDYEYVNAQIRCKLICPVGHEYDALARSFSGDKQVKCSSCTNNNPKKAKKEFEEAVQERGYELASTYTYINARTHVDLICPKGTPWAVVPDTFKNAGVGCPCCIENHLTWQNARDDFEFEIKYRKYTLLDDYKYVTASTPVKFKCRNGHLLEMTPHALRYHIGCKHCRRERLRKEFEDLAIARGYTFPDTYKYYNATTEVTLICPKGTYYYVAPTHFHKTLHGCPCCDGQDKSIARDAFEERVLERGYEFADTYEYINARTHADLICPNGCSYSVVPYAFKDMNTGCPCCAPKAQPRPETKERFEAYVLERGYKFADNYDYVNSKEKVWLLCPKGTAYHCDPMNFMAGKGCLCCIGRLPEQQKQAFEEEVYRRGYRLAETYNYINAKERVDLICPRGSLYRAYPSGFKSGTDCPCCCQNGFNPSEPGYLYLQELWSQGELIALKFGITNREPEERMKEHMKESIFEHVLTEHYVYSEYGQDIWDVEQDIKLRFHTHFVSRSDMEDGWTETVSVEHYESLKEVISYYRYCFE